MKQFTATRIYTVFALGCFWAAACVAEAENDSRDWRQQREQLLLQIDAAVKTQVEEDLPPARLAQELGLPYPVPAPGKAIEEVFAEVRELSLNAVSRPDRDLVALSREAERLYPLFKVGDQVTLRTTIPTSPEVSGIIYQISSARVQLGHRWLLYKDLVEEHRIALDEQRTMTRRTNYVTQQLRLTNDAILQQQQQFLNQQLPEKMRQSGYVCLDPHSKDLFAAALWQPMDKYFQSALETASAEAAARLRPTIEKRIFSENGFRYYESRKEWRPGGVLQRLKSFFAD